VPKLHAECPRHGMQRKRAKLAEGYLTGEQMARKLGIGQTTLRRWLRVGKLRKRTKSIAGMLLFDRGAVRSTG